MNAIEFTPYQYSIIRYYHDAATHEFLNIGVALFATAFNYFKVNITTKYSRITDTFFNADGDEYRNHVNMLLRRFEKMSEDISNEKNDLFTTPPDNIEILLRTYLRKESSFRYSNPANGIAPASMKAINDTFSRLFTDYVERYMQGQEKYSRTEEEVWRCVYRPKIEKVESSILNKLIPKQIDTPVDQLAYEHAWQNGRWHLIQPISFDLVRPGSIIEKAHRHLGRNVLLNSSEEVSHLYLLLGRPLDKEQDVNDSYNRAKDIISANGFRYKLELIEEDGADDFATYLFREVSHAE